ncbi:MAG: M14 family zinc carboxypeptidase [Bacteroidota bacterium]
MSRLSLPFHGLAASFLLAVLFVLPLRAQVPTYADVVGHEFGERITQHHEMVAYLQALEASDRVELVYLGESWEGRSLWTAIVTSPENHARLDDIQATVQRLADPRGLSEAEAAELMAGQPTVMWFGACIHGFELSATEGALRLLEHLTTRSDAATMSALENTVVLIDPMVNPDGRDAFAQENHERIGAFPNPSRTDWNNRYTSFEALKYRTTHYYFDGNRDWFANTQPETRARIPLIRDWRPQVAVDMHEMGSDVEFYFDPPALPYGPYTSEFAKNWYIEFGQAFSEAFDEEGYQYFNRERFNYFYPGYTGSYMTFQGAVGMLFEQGSTRGLSITRADETVRTLRDATDQQYTAAWAAVRLSAAERERLLSDYVASGREAVAAGQQGNRRYFIHPDEGDPNLIAEMVNLFTRHGVEVQQLTAEASVGGVLDRTGEAVGTVAFPAGTYVIDAAQPLSRFIRILMEPDVPMEPEFVAEARRKVMRDENPRFYDLTVFSLPMLFNVSGYATPQAGALSTEPVPPMVRDQMTADVPRASYAYVIPGHQTAAVAAAYHLTSQGFRVAVMTRPTQVGDTEVSSGSVVVRVGQNPDTIHQAVQDAALEFRLDVLATGTGQAPAPFPTLGSGDFNIHLKPTKRIGIVAEDPIQAYSFGWAWYTLDQQYAIPTTIYRTRFLGSTDLSEVDVLVMPEVYDTTAMKTLLGTGGVRRIQQWVRDGGTLVALGRGVDMARGPLGLIDLRSWYDEEENEGAQRFFVPGAMFETTLDPQDWLASGYTEETMPALVFSNRLYLAPEGPPNSRKRVVAHYTEGQGALAGHAWEESQERMPGTVFAYEERIGAGRVIAFAEDINFRAFWRGADRLFLNAVILGPSAP